MHRRLTFAWSRPVCGIRLGAQNVGRPAALIADAAMRRRPNWRCLAGGAGSCRARSSERGCAADQTLAVTAFGTDIELLPIARDYTELYAGSHHWDQIASVRGAFF